MSAFHSFRKSEVGDIGGAVANEEVSFAVLGSFEVNGRILDGDFLEHVLSFLIWADV